MDEKQKAALVNERAGLYNNMVRLRTEMAYLEQFQPFMTKMVIGKEIEAYIVRITEIEHLLSEDGAVNSVPTYTETKAPSSSLSFIEKKFRQLEEYYSKYEPSQQCNYAGGKGCESCTTGFCERRDI